MLPILHHVLWDCRAVQAAVQVPLGGGGYGFGRGLPA
jgi:hypothetical protein